MGVRAITRRTVRNLLGRCGFELRRRSCGDASLDARLIRVLREERATIVLDVGANRGGFVDYLRGQGYEGRVISFEPLPEPLADLSARAAASQRWEVVGMALSDKPGAATMRRSGPGDVTSSLLEAASALNVAYPEAAPGASVDVHISTLDEQAHTLLREDDRPFVKIDTQGSELAVLRGAERTLTQAVGVLAELSFVELYVGQALFGEVGAWLAERGFVLTALAPAFHDQQTGALLQVDALFERSRAGVAT